MFVEEIMTKNVVTVSPHNSLKEALKLISDNRIRHLPVVSAEGKLVGIVTDRDLRDAKPSNLEAERINLLSNIQVNKIMKTNPITAHPLDTIDDAARLLYSNKIGCLPVVTEETIVGIITHGDLLRSLVELMGVDSPGSLFIIEFQDRPGVLAEISQIIKSLDVNINSIFLRRVKDKPGLKTLTIRVSAMIPEPIIDEIRKAGFKILWP